MRCSKCGSENRGDRRFCAECGGPLSRSCPSCGFLNDAADKFCGGCGRAVAEMPPSDRESESYVPPHLAEKILTARDALEGERKQVTVLFADIRGSLELLQGRDPEEVRQIIDPSLRAMVEAVHRYEGTVNNMMGDGIMAIFGAPVAHEDHAARACYAALAMQSMMGGFSDQARRTHGVEIQVRVGIHSGEVVVRSIRSDLQMEYDAIGTTTHLAARMEQLATPGTIRLTQETVRLAEGCVKVAPLGPIPVKGLPEPVEVFELLGAEPRRRRLETAAARGLTRFVGRSRELATLERARDLAAGEQGQVVGVVGEPGVGKSRLFWEFTPSLRTKGWVVLESSSVSHGKSTAYGAVVEALRGYLGLEPSADPRAVRERVTGKLLTLDPSLQSSVPAVLALLGMPVDEPEWHTLESSQQRQRIQRAVKCLLLAESRNQPVCLALEDLQWVDSETQALLDALVDGVPAAPLLLLFNYRPEYEHAWGNRPHYTNVRIEPLPPESAHELLAELLGDDPAHEVLTQALIDRTEGNPFFLEESVRALSETGHLTGERGAYRAAGPVGEIRIPPTVQAVIAARIDRLASDDKRLLQSAAAIGKDVSFDLLHAIAELPEEEVRRGLRRLQQGEFLYETSIFPELEYTFTHALTNEVAYRSLVHDRRRKLHARIAGAIEVLYPSRSAELVESLAHHAFHGEEWEKAVRYLRQAGTRAVARSANREALGRFEQALTALHRLPESRERAEQEVDLRFDLRKALLALGEFDRAFEHLREAKRLAESLEDAPRLGRVYSYMTNRFWQNGEHERALETGGRALAIAEREDDFRLRVATNFYLGQAHHHLGNYRGAVDFNRRNVEALRAATVERGGAPFAFAVLSSAWLVWSLAELGEFREAVLRGEEGVRVARQMNKPFLLVHAYIGTGALYVRKGDLDRAIPALEASLQLCRTWDFPVFYPMLLPLLGHAYSLVARHDEAAPLLEEGLEQAGTRIRVAQSVRLMWLGEAYLLAGRLPDAREPAERALELTLKHGERGYEAWTLRLLGEICGRVDPPEFEHARERFTTALDRARELEMRPLQAQCHLEIGALERRRERAEEARRHLSEAVALFESMEMHSLQQRAENELSALGRRRGGRRSSRANGVRTESASLPESV